MENAGAQAQTSQSGGVIAWIRTHDERALFVLTYISLAVLLTIFISLFWLVAVVAVHGLFEVIRQYSRFDAPSQYLAEAAWEIKLDIALVFFALALALYMDVILGVLGLQSAARAGAAARAGGRFLVWERTIRAIALTIDDVFNVGRFIRPIAGLFRRNGQPEQAAPPAQEPVERPETTAWVQPYGWGDRLSLGLGIACVALIAASPLFTHHTPSTVMTTLAAELHPFPFD